MPKLAPELTKEVASASRDLAIPVYGGDSLKAGDGAILYSNDPRFYQTCDLIASDCHAYSVLQKRSLAVIGKEYEVKPASSSRADKKAADLVKAQLAAMARRGADEENGEAVIQAVSGFDQSCFGLLDAILKGYTPAEIMWDTDGSEIVASEVRIREQRRFTFVPSPLGYKPRLLTSANSYQGEPLPPRKFIFHTFAPSYGPRGRGLATRLFWPVFFKRQGIRFWLVFSDKYGSPTAVGKYPKGSSTGQKQDLLDTIDAIATEAGIILPEGMDVTLLEATRSSSTSTYEGLANYMDKEASKAVLGETLSTDIGNTGSRAASETHNSVRQELVKADADLLSETLNRTLVRWITNLNLPDANPPTVWRIIEQPEDLNSRVTRDKTLFDLGYRMTQEKVAEVYGEGYQDIQSPRPDGQNGVKSDDAFLAASGVSSDNGNENPFAFAETVDFKTVTKTNKKQKNCVKGIPCKGQCISANKVCRTGLEGDAVKAADYLDEKVPKGRGKPEPTTKPSKTQKTAPSQRANFPDGVTPLKKLAPESISGDSESKGTTADERKQFMKDRPESKSRLAEAKKAMKKIPGAPPPHPEELVALQEYTGLYYGPINAVLRGNDREILAKPLTAEQRQKYLEDARFASAALDALPNHTGTVYRGAALPKSVIDQYEVGKTITEKAFTSTSTKPDVAVGFESSGDGQSAVRYAIQSRRGKSVKSFSAVSGEEEILFNSNTQFKVLGKKTKNGVVHIYLEEV